LMNGILGICNLHILEQFWFEFPFPQLLIMLPAFYVFYALICFSIHYLGTYLCKTIVHVVPEISFNCCFLRVLT
jgi:hypothetical protein